MPFLMMLQVTLQKRLTGLPIKHHIPHPTTISGCFNRTAKATPFDSPGFQWAEHLPESRFHQVMCWVQMNRQADLFGFSPIHVPHEKTGFAQASNPFQLKTQGGDQQLCGEAPFVKYCLFFELGV